MKFTAAQLFNKATDDVNLPVIPFQSNKSLVGQRKLSNIDYFKHMKEKFEIRQTLIDNEQILVK
jgi:hypothetical protein